MFYIWIVKIFLTISLSVLMLMASIRDIAFTAYFYTQQNALAQKYCINLDKPEVMCHARCYLHENLSHDQEQNQLITSLGSKIVLMKVQQDELPNLFPIINKAVPLAYNTVLYKQDYHGNILQPPIA